MKELRAAPKPQRIRSKALTNSAKGKACTLRGPWCGSEGGPDAVFCHVRLVGNAGTATKPPDFFGYYGCRWCHRQQEARDGIWFTDRDVMRAICETQYLMATEGLLIIRGWKP